MHIRRRTDSVGGNNDINAAIRIVKHLRLLTSRVRLWNANTSQISNKSTNHQHRLKTKNRDKYAIDSIIKFRLDTSGFICRPGGWHVCNVSVPNRQPPQTARHTSRHTSKHHTSKHTRPNTRSNTRQNTRTRRPNTHTARTGRLP